MADNVIANAGAGGTTFRTDDLGGVPAIHVPYTKILLGGDGVDAGGAPGDAANGIDVDVTRLPALVAGTANIGDVDVLTVPAPLSTTGGGTEATALRVTIASDSTGLVSVDDNGGSLTIDGSVSITGAVDTELPAAETPADALTNATAAPRVGAFAYGFNGTTWDRLRSDTTNGLDVDVTRLPALVAGSANIGDVDVLTVPAPLSTTGNGTAATALRVTVASDSTGTLAVTQATAANLNAEVQGETADGTAQAGNPVSTGLIARTTNRTAVADGAAVRAASDDMGRAVVILNNVRDLVVQSAAITLSTTTETTLIAAGAAGVFHDLTQLMVTNTSATAVRVDFRDTTAGTVMFSIAIAANGGAIVPFNVPWKQTTAALNWTAQLSAAVTDVRIAAQAVKNV